VAIKAIRQDKMVKKPVIQRVSLLFLTLFHLSPLQRFWREAQSWWCLDHKNILRMYGIVEPGKFGFLAAMISLVS
jgi:hypothetical protein